MLKELYGIAVVYGGLIGWSRGGGGEGCGDGPWQRERKKDMFGGRIATAVAFGGERMWRRRCSSQKDIRTSLNQDGGTRRARSSV